MAEGLNNPKEAKNFLESTFKKPIGELVDGYGSDPLKVNYAKKNIDHVNLANTLLKFINTTPGIHPMSRKIINKKICAPGITDMQVALTYGLRVNEVRAFELDGINRVEQELRKTSLQDGINKFNVERAIQTEIKNQNDFKT